MTGRSPTRRRLLAAAGTAAATALAGCGYRAAGGELDWTATASDPGPFGVSRSESAEWLSDGEFLYRLRNFEGETFTVDGWNDVDEARVAAYDSSGDVAWRGVADRQFRGPPAVADGRVYLPLEDGSVTALERAASTDDGPGRTRTDSDDVAVAWSEPWRGDGTAPRELVAGGDLVVGADGDRIVGYDAASGAERFSLGLESIGLDALTAVAVVGERTWILGGGELRCVDGDGSVRAERSIPSAGGWLEATASGAVLAADDGLVVVGSDGDRRLEVAVAGVGSTPVVVEDGDLERLYHYGTGTLTAVDVAGGELGVAWTLEEYSFPGGVVADADGVYGQGSAPGMDRCGLVGLTESGDDWWRVPPLEDLGCSGTAHLVGDRLVVRDGTDLYGFRSRPGSRYTLL